MNLRKDFKILERKTELIALLGILLLLAAGYGYANSDIDLTGKNSDELVAEYRLDTGAGDTVYDTAGNNDGTIAGASWAEGVSGKGINFPSANGEVSIPDSEGFEDAFSGSKVTVSFWLYPRSGSDWKDYWQISGSAGETHRMEQGGNGVDSLYFALADTSGSKEKIHKDGVLTPNSWNHLVGVYDGSEMALYVDGEKVGSLTSSFTLGGTDSNLYLNPSQSENAKIDSFKVYNAALNQSQIKSLYNRGSQYRVGSEESSDASNVLDMTFQHKNSTHVLDTSGYGNHGQPQNGVSQENAVNCEVGRCYSFDGVDDRVDISNNQILDSMQNGYTWMIWFKGGNQSNDWPRLLDFGDTTLRSDGPSSDFRAWTSTDGSRCNHVIGEDSTLGDQDKEWHHATFVYNGTHNKLYVNGFLNDQGTCSGTLDTGHDFNIGADSGNNEFNGSIDQVKIFNRSLSQQEIIEKTEGLSSDGAVLDMRFDSGGGDVAFDSSSHGNHGDINPNETFGAQWVEGVEGTGLRNDGNSGDGGNPPAKVPRDSSLEPEEEITMSAWFRTRDYTQGPQTIAMKWVGYNFNYRWDGSKPYLWFELRGDDGNTYNADADDVVGEWSVENNEWYHLLQTYDGEYMRTYVDGELYQENKVGDFSINYDSDPVDIGAWGSNRQLKGRIDSLKIYPYSVSKSKIKQLYTQGSNRLGQESGKQSSSPGGDGLVLHQSFDLVETCGQSDTLSCPSGMSGEIAVDESGEANHGELVNGPIEKDSDGCKIGRCLDFDGEDDFVDAGNRDSLNITYNITVSGWAKFSDTSNYRQLIDKRNSGAYGSDREEAGWFLRPIRVGGGEAEFIVGNGSGSWDAGAGRNWADGDWHHYSARRFAGEYIQLYVDGEKVGSNQDYGGTINSDDNVLIGGGQKWNGSIDEVRVYNRSLSKDEIWRLYTQGRDRSSGGEMAGPSGRWEFVEEYGGKVYDKSEANDGIWNSNGPATEKRYIVNEDHANRDLRVAAYENGTEVEAGSCKQELARGDTHTFSSSCYSVADTVESQKPFSAHFQYYGSDGPVPESFAGKEFAYTDCRGGEYLNLVSPYSSASVTIRNSTHTLDSVSVSEGGHKEVYVGTPSYSAYTVESDSKILATYDGDPWGSSMTDAFTMHPVSDNLWGLIEYTAVSKDNTKVEVYDSDGNMVADSVYDKFDTISTSVSGQGGSESYHVTANKSALGGWRCADGDNGETDIAVPNNEMSKAFRLPEPVAGAGDNEGDYYISLTASEATTCEVRRSNGEKVLEKSSTNSPPYPGFITFDTHNDFNLTEAGAFVSCEDPVNMQWEPSNYEGEANLYGTDIRPEGVSNKALEFDGKDDYVSLPNSFTLDREGAAISWWMNPEDASATGLFSASDSGSYDQHIEARSGRIFAETNQNCNNFDFGQYSKETGWNHYTIVFNNSKAYLYENGEYLGEATNYGNDGCGGNSVDKMVADTTLQYIGVKTNYNTFYSGKIDDVRIYPYALSEDQVKQVMNDGAASVG